MGGQLCECGCTLAVTGAGRYASAACRVRAMRARKAAGVTPPGEGGSGATPGVTPEIGAQPPWVEFHARFDAVEAALAKALAANEERILAALKDLEGAVDAGVARLEHAAARAQVLRVPPALRPTLQPLPVTDAIPGESRVEPDPDHATWAEGAEGKPRPARPASASAPAKPAPAAPRPK